MAEDRANPLNNPQMAEAISHPAPASEPPPRNDELEDFLDEVLETPEPQASAPPPREQGVSTPEPAQAVSPGAPPTPSADAPTAHPAPAAPPEAAAPDSEALQQEVLRRLNEQLQRMAEPAPQEPAPPPQVTPDQLYRQYQDRIQQYTEAGWLDEDFVALYPKQAALMVHMWDMGTGLQQGVQQTQAFTQAEETRRAQESASKQLDDAIAAVAARGEVFGALGTDEVRQGFREFLIDLNPHMSQITPDFLARQFYAYNSQLIYDLAKQQSQNPSVQPDGPSAAQLARQEGAGTRAAPTTAQVPEFADLLEGHAASRWYQ
jgi:hypothetical protein